MDAFKYIILTVVISLSPFCSAVAQTEGKAVKATNEVKAPGNVSAASQDNVEKYMNEKFKLQDEVKNLQREEGAIQTELRQLKGKFKTDTTKIASISKEIEALENSDNYKKYLKLVQEKDSLNNKLDALEADIKDVKGDISELDKKVASADEDKKSLVAVTDDICKELVDKYYPEIEKSFSALTVQKLDAIIADCNKYKDNKLMKELKSKAEVVLKKKKFYDASVDLLSQKLNKAEFYNTIAKLKDMKCTDAQKADVKVLLDKMDNFELGLTALKEFVTAYGKRRAIVSSSSALEGSITTIMGRNDLKKRIDDFVKPIPYLNNKFNEYLKAIRANFKVVPAVEQEILEQ